MSKSKRRKGRNKLAFPLGMIIIAFAFIGIVFSVSKGIDGIKNIIDKSNEKLKYQEMLVPVVMFDPDMFDDVSTANLDQLTCCAVWDIIKDSDNYDGKYQTDDEGHIVIPVEDVNKRFVKLFGKDVTPTHVGVKSYYDEFSYNEQSHCYLVNSVGSVPLYTPKVTKIEKNANSITLIVGYLAGEAWAQDDYGNFVEPEPTKYVKVILRESGSDYYISAMTTSDVPEAARAVVTNPPTQPQTDEFEITSELESDTDVSTEESTELTSEDESSTSEAS